MADIEFLSDGYEDTPDVDDDPGLGCEDYDGEPINHDDCLTPLQKLETYMDSDNIFRRQMVARSLLETVRSVGDFQEASTVTERLEKLSQDAEPSVRGELMEQVPHLAVYCHENTDLFPEALPRYLLPIITRYLTDSHNQVRKTSQAALLVLLEQELVDKEHVEQQVCPVLIDLSSPESVDDFRTEAVALMSKMAPLVGRDITQNFFMPRFAEMCTDALFHVRKVCAANFGDVCTVVGQENTEKHLLPKFYYLCEDGVWGVRKACAECFMTVSCACTHKVRKTELAKLFVDLICDSSRWVRMAAFQALGGFISTFADPSTTGLYFNDEGMLVAGNPEEFLKRSISDEKVNETGVKETTESLVDETSSSTESKEEADPVSPSNAQSVEVPSNCDSTESPQTDPKEPANNPSGTTVSGNNVNDNTEVVAMEVDAGNSGENENESNGAKQSPGEEVSPEEVRAEKYKDSHVPKEAEELKSKKNPVMPNEPSDTDELSESKGGESSPQVSGDDEEKGALATSEDTKTEEPAEHGHSVVNVSLEEPAGQASDIVLSCEDGSSQEDSASLERTDSPTGKKPVHIHLDNLTAFNAFQFWRTPLPEVDLDFDLVNGKPTNIHVTTKVKDDEHSKVYTTEIDVKVKKKKVPTATLR